MMFRDTWPDITRQQAQTMVERLLSMLDAAEALRLIQSIEL
jgi:hypothetical protein